MKRFLLVAGLLWTFSTAYGVGSDENIEPETRPSEPITLTNDMLFWYNLNYREQSFGMAWGLDPMLSARIQSVPSAKAMLETYETLNSMATTGFVAGASSSVLGLTVLLAAKSVYRGKGSAADIAAVQWGIVGGVTFWVGIITTAVSIPLGAVGNLTLRNGVDRYNSDRPQAAP